MSGTHLDEDWRLSDRGADSEFVTTLHYPRRTEWVRRGTCLTADSPATARRFVRTLRAARPGQPVVLNGFHVADLLAGMVLARTRRAVPVVMVDCTWQRGRNPMDRLLTRCGVRLLAGPETTFCVSSEEEARRWPELWGVDASRVAVLHWHHGIDDTEQEPYEGDGTVFSGGRALRDYATLLAAVRSLGAPVRIAADPASLAPVARPADNLMVGQLPTREFHQRLATSSAVVVSLEAGAVRSAGQTTYLDAMALGGLVIVSDTIGVREHIEHGISGLLFPPGDVGELSRLLDWALDPDHASEVRRIRTAARQRARERFGPQAFVSTLLRIVESSAARVAKTRS